MKKNSCGFWLLIILILGFVLRFAFLDRTPAGFHQDEVVNAYVGKFILKNGFDPYGNKLPIFYFDKWGDYPPVIPMYFAGLGALIFGNNIFAARVVIAFFGFFTLIINYFFIKKVFNNKNLALISTLFLATNFWHINLSRVAAEGVLGLFFLLMGLFFLFDFDKKIHLLLGSFFLYFTYLIYPGYRVLVPLIFLGLTTFFLKNRYKNLFLIFLLTVLSFFINLIIAKTFWGQARFGQTSVLNTVINKQDYYNQYLFNERSVFLARVFNNKIIYLFKEFLGQYFSYFSFNFLFLTGGKPNWFNLPNSGVFYLSYFFLFFLFLVNYQRFFSPLAKKKIDLFFYFLAISVIPAALTSELTPHLHRSFPLVVFFILFSAFGFLILIRFYSSLSRWLVLLIIIEFIYCSHNYFQHLSMETAVSRSDGNWQMAVFLRDSRQRFNQVNVYISGWFPIYYLYFSDDYSPSLVGKIERGMRLKVIDNINFINKDCPTEGEIKNYQQNSLLIIHSSCQKIENINFKKVFQIKNVNGTPIYIGYLVK